MRKKEPWMYVGAKVLALDQPGTITEMQENQLNGVDYVYYIYVRLDTLQHANPYHPNDVQKAEA